MLCESLVNIRSFPQFSSLLERNIYCGIMPPGQICLSFDDGPSAHTVAVLDLLAAREVKAVFFMLGQSILQHPEIAGRVAAEGHVIAAHGFVHSDITQMSEAAFCHSLQSLEDCVEALGLPLTKWFRPPFGEIDGAKAACLDQLGYTPLLWTRDSFDWKLDWPQMQANLIQLSSLDHTFLFHDGVWVKDINATLKAVSWLIDQAQRQGLAFTTRLQA